MIITKTPFRISFAGGGSDLPAFYERHEGCVLSTTINKYMYVAIHPTFNREETVVKYSRTETVGDCRKIQHPIARQLLLDHGVSGVEISSMADVPSGTGLSTSSAYTVGLIHALYAYQGKFCSQQRIAREACELEIDKLGEPIGKQDQYGTALGGIKFIRFLPDGSVDVEPLVISRTVLQQLDENLLLFYTGLTHSSGVILKEENKNIAFEEEKFQNLIRMTELAKAMRDALLAGRLCDFGSMLSQYWLLKKQLAGKISNSVIDEYYQLGMDSGALGGKLLGAGGGGFLMFYCEKKYHERLRSALNQLVELPFSLENSGTKIIYVGEKEWD